MKGHLLKAMVIKARLQVTTNKSKRGTTGEQVRNRSGTGKGSDG